MANEISASINCTISQSGQNVSGSKSFTATLSGASFIGEGVTIGSTTAAPLYIGGLSNPAIVVVINQDTTNFITVAGDAPLANFPQKILPGQGVLLNPETGTIYAKADTAPCQAWVVAG
jgi:hypothetical protein